MEPGPLVGAGNLETHGPESPQDHLIPVDRVRRAAVEGLASQHPSRAEIVEQLSGIVVATVGADPASDEDALAALLGRQARAQDPYLRAAAGNGVWP